VSPPFGTEGPIGVLACLGWPGRRIGWHTSPGSSARLVAGLLGLAISAPLGLLLGVRLTWGHACSPCRSRSV
jgi:hypothetical protein